jgi:RimJ/RimL family protein N-acetyltransferase
VHLLRRGGKSTRPHPLLTRRALLRGLSNSGNRAHGADPYELADDVVALNADTEVMRYLDHGRPMTPARVLAEEMPRLMAHNGRADRLGSWVARDRGTGNFLGWFMITPVDEPLRNVELAYRLRRKAWGRGYDIEGMLCMIEIARAAHVSTVIATMMAVDVVSRRLMEKAGLHLVQTSVSETTGPTTAAARREVDYALDLTTGAKLPA